MDLIQVMQASIAPVTLISGVGLILLSMTNRYGRVIDRARELIKQVPEAKAGDDTHHVRRQVRYLYDRARIMRRAIVAAEISIFCVALSIFMIFAELTFQLHLAGLVQLVFASSLVSLMISAALYIQEISKSLDAMRLEISAHDEDLL
ncbi:MAG: DUF2721 domain-containing protein [Deltaproteobacteria bacterium]|nr:DUF2721 domain-containing protein [Deltaproteobacteria bacterium]